MIMLLSEGQMSDYKGAALMVEVLPKARVMLGDRGYDADWFRAALTKRGIAPCIPSKANRKVLIPHGVAVHIGIVEGRHLQRRHHGIGQHAAEGLGGGQDLGLDDGSGQGDQGVAHVLVGTQG
mgnify:CR=1 FL=1